MSGRTSAAAEDDASGVCCERCYLLAALAILRIALWSSSCIPSSSVRVSGRSRCGSARCGDVCVSRPSFAAAVCRAVVWSDVLPRARVVQPTVRASSVARTTTIVQITLATGRLGGGWTIAPAVVRVRVAVFFSDVVSLELGAMQRRHS